MAKINLNDIPFEEAIIHVRKWHKNKLKDGGIYSGNYDPFITEKNMIKRFTVNVELASKLIDYFLSLDDKYQPYYETVI